MPAGTPVFWPAVSEKIYMVPSWLSWLYRRRSWQINIYFKFDLFWWYMFYTLLHQFILKYFEQNNASNCFCNILNTIDVFFVPIMMNICLVFSKFQNLNNVLHFFAEFANWNRFRRIGRKGMAPCFRGIADFEGLGGYRCDSSNARGHDGRNTNTKPLMRLLPHCYLKSVDNWSIGTNLQATTPKEILLVN